MTEQENEEIKRTKLSDAEFVDELIGHIVHPCGFDTKKGESINLRTVYLREAKRALETIVDPEAKTKLEDTIRIWGRFENEEQSR